MDRDYLERTVARPLLLALREVAWMEPPDPIDYLAGHLRQWVRNSLNAAETNDPQPPETLLQDEHLVHPANVPATPGASLETLHSLGGEPFTLFETAAAMLRARTSADSTAVALFEHPWRELPSPRAPGDNVPAKLLHYVAADSESSWMIGKQLVNGDGPGEGGVSFSLLTSPQRCVDVPSAMASADAVNFFHSIPRPGSYFAAAIVLQCKRVGMLAMDTLRRADGSGSGAKFSEDDKDFALQVASALGQSLTAAEARRAAAAQRFNVPEQLRLARAEGAANAALEASTDGGPSLARLGSNDSSDATQEPTLPPEEALEVARRELAAVTKVLRDLHVFVLADLRTLPAPSQDVLLVCQAALLVAGYAAAEVGRSWMCMHALLTEAFLARVCGSCAVPPSAASVCSAALAAVEQDQLDSQSARLLFMWLSAVVQVQHASELVCRMQREKVSCEGEDVEV